MKPSVPESDILASCLDYLATTRRAFAWRQNQGALRVPKSDTTKARFVRFAAVAGIADIIGVMRCGHFLAVECKREGKGPTIDQHAFLTSVDICHGCAIVARSVDELVRGLDAHDAVCLFRGGGHRV